MRIRALFTVTAAIALLAATGIPGTTAPASGAVVRKLEGKVISMRWTNRSFLIEDERRATTYRIYVRPSTRFARGLKGYRSLRKDLEIEVRASRSPGHRLIARQIELD